MSHITSAADCCIQLFSTYFLMTKKVFHTRPWNDGFNVVLLDVTSCCPKFRFSSICIIPSTSALSANFIVPFELLCQGQETKILSVGLQASPWRILLIKLCQDQYASFHTTYWHLPLNQFLIHPTVAVFFLIFSNLTTCFHMGNT